MSALNIKRRESAIEDKFVETCEAEGWHVRKYATPGKAGAPDRIVLAGTAATGEVNGWAELKRPGRPLDPQQVIEIREMQAKGCFVMRINSAFDIATFVATMRRRVRDAAQRF